MFIYCSINLTHKFYHQISHIMHDTGEKKKSYVVLGRELILLVPLEMTHSLIRLQIDSEGLFHLR